jgi:hypothetical protein
MFRVVLLYNNLYYTTSYVAPVAIVKSGMITKNCQLEQNKTEISRISYHKGWGEILEGCVIIIMAIIPWLRVIIYILVNTSTTTVIICTHCTVEQQYVRG